MSANLKEARDRSGKYVPYAWPGGYPVLYIMEDGGVLCAPCANRENGSLASDKPDTPRDWRIVGYSVMEEWEGIDCDHCGKLIAEDWS